MPATALAAVPALHVVLLGENQVTLLAEVVVTLFQPKTPETLGTFLLFTVGVHGLVAHCVLIGGTNRRGLGSFTGPKVHPLALEGTICGTFFSHSVVGSAVE
jgi:hypothetical protein